MSESQLKKDCETLDIEDIENITIKHVTAKYKKLAKLRHPDREGGTTEGFQVLQSAYKRVIRYLEQNDAIDDDYEKEFFMEHNVCKECTTSYEVYIQNKDVKTGKLCSTNIWIDIELTQKGQYLKLENSLLHCMIRPKQIQGPRYMSRVETNRQILNS